MPEIEADDLPWGEHPYDRRTVADVVYDYAVIRGDLSEQYARDQLVGWIERLVRHRVVAAADWQYGSVRPGASEPDVFYETFAQAVADCAMGPCRIVRRSLGPWVPVGQSVTSRQPEKPDPVGLYLDILESTNPSPKTQAVIDRIRSEITSPPGASS